MNSRTTILVIAILCLGLFALPQTLALFTGMHHYVLAEETDCAKCHPAEMAELGLSVYHVNFAPGPMGVADIHDCVACHQHITFMDAPGGIAEDEAEPHAAVTIPCIACHPGAGPELLNETEAHIQFYRDALNATIQMDANEACVTCHTMAGFEYVPTPPTNFTYNINLPYDERWGTAPR